METLQALEKRIVTSGKLQSIVKSMKTLAAVSIRQYERAVDSLDTYVATIEFGLQVALRTAPLSLGRPRNGETRRALVIFGSDQGLCGRFNERLAGEVRAAFLAQAGEIDAASPLLLVIGARVAARLEAEGLTVQEQFWVPSSVTGINSNVFRVLLTLEQWQREHGVGRVDLHFNRRRQGNPAEPVRQALLPFDEAHFVEFARRPWPSRCLPQARIPAATLFSALLRQHLFVSLFRAQAESLASEQASRLQSLQNAEKNIGEHVEELKSEFRVKRQATITAELLDLVAGYKVAARVHHGGA